MNTNHNCLWAALAIGVASLLSSWPTSAYAEVKVFACEPDWASLAKEIGGDLVSVYSATTALQDPHSVQARPSLIARLRNADILICNGAELEIRWLPTLLVQSANGSVQPGSHGNIMVAQYVKLLDHPAQFDRSSGDVHPAGNPHINTGPQNIQVASRLLVERLSTIDPDHVSQFQTRYKDFSERWEVAMSRWRVRAVPLRGLPVVEHHKTWIYLMDWLGMEELGFLEPKPGIPPSRAHLSTLLAQLKFRLAKMVIRSAYEAPQPSELLSKKAGIPQIMLPYSVGGTPGAKDLFGLFDDTIDRLLQGVQGKSVVVPAWQPLEYVAGMIRQ